MFKRLKATNEFAKLFTGTQVFEGDSQRTTHHTKHFSGLNDTGRIVGLIHHRQHLCPNHQDMRLWDLNIVQ